MPDRVSRAMEEKVAIRISARSSSCLLGLINKEIAGVIQYRDAQHAAPFKADIDLYLRLLQECSVGVIAAHMAFVQKPRRKRR